MKAKKLGCVCLLGWHCLAAGGLSLSEDLFEAYGQIGEWEALGGEHGRFLQDLYSRCASSGRPVDFDGSCQRVSYLESVKRLERSLAWRAEEEEEEEEKEHRQSSPMPILSSPSFKEFFVDFEVKRRPVHLKDLPSPFDAASIPSQDESSLSSSQEEPRSLLLLLHECTSSHDREELQLGLECPQAASSLMIPLYAVSDYFSRISSAADDELAVEFTRRFPLVYRTPAGASARPMSCPYGTHGFLMIAGASKPVNIRTFSPHHSGSALNPEFGSRDSKWPHMPHFRGDAWDSSQSKFTFASASDGEAIFVPEGWVFSWQTAESAPGVTDDEYFLVLHCFADASNLNKVREGLQLQAMVDEGAASVLRMLHSPHFDPKMERVPKSEILTAMWQRRELLLSSPSSSIPPSSEGFHYSEKGEESNETFPREGSSKKSRNRRGRKAYKDWQEGGQWENLVMGLTLPGISYPPSFLECGRNWLTLNWLSSYIPREHDPYPTGFRVHWRRLDVESNRKRAGSDELELIEGRSTEVWIGDPRLGDEYYHGPGVVTDARKFLFTLQEGLEPDTVYCFAVQLLHGEHSGAMSLWSKGIRTKALSLPYPVPRAPEIVPEGLGGAVLKIFKPEDDGGLPLERWELVMRQSSVDSFPEGWQEVGSYPVSPPPIGFHESPTDYLSVPGLLPDVGYEFRVRAVNALGHGRWSPISNVHLVNAASVLQVLANDGGGSQSAAEKRRSRRHRRLSALGRDGKERGLLVRVRDQHTAQVSILPRDNSINDLAVRDMSAWHGHFSPQTFEVIGEAVAVSPAFADTPQLDNERNIRGRIAVVMRGRVPIVKKILAAQAAGALCVIIVDDTGKCEEYFSQRCMPGSDPPDGWASKDNPTLWSKVRIPHVLLSSRDGQSLWREIATHGPKYGPLVEDELIESERSRRLEARNLFELEDSGPIDTRSSFSTEELVGDERELEIVLNVAELETVSPALPPSDGADEMDEDGGERVDDKEDQEEKFGEVDDSETHWSLSPNKLAESNEDGGERGDDKVEQEETFSENNVFETVSVPLTNRAAGVNEGGGEEEDREEGVLGEIDDSETGFPASFGEAAEVHGDGGEEEDEEEGLLGEVYGFDTQSPPLPGEAALIDEVTEDGDKVEEENLRS